jgi:K319-like protein
MPIAKINTPDNLQFGQNLTLDASSSSDTDGSITEYIWSYNVNGGNGREENTTTKSPILNFASSVLLANSTLQFELTVKDDDGDLSKPAVKITNMLPDYPPLVNAGKERVMNIGELCVDEEIIYLFEPPKKANQITLDASNSTDPEGAPLTYKWSVVDILPSDVPQVDNPTGNMSTQTNGTAFFAYEFCKLIEPTVFKFMVDVTDNATQTVSKGVTITVNGFQSLNPNIHKGIDNYSLYSLLNLRVNQEVI